MFPLLGNERNVEFFLRLRPTCLESGNPNLCLNRSRSLVNRWISRHGLLPLKLMSLSCRLLPFKSQRRFNVDLCVTLRCRSADITKTPRPRPTVSRLKKPPVFTSLLTAPTMPGTWMMMKRRRSPSEASPLQPRQQTCPFRLR